MNKLKQNWYFISIILILILAFVLRIKTYLLARPLWHDECSLAVNIMLRDILGFFQPLENDQKAPAIFMMLNKIISYPFGIKELSLRFIPFLSGLFSVIGFYFLSKKILKNKISIISANFLFAVNYQLISFAQRFKQYSFDVLLFIASILLLTKLDLDKISYKKCLLYSFVSLLLIFASFPCTFVVMAYILYSILIKTNIKKILSFSSPLILICLLYYLTFLLPGQKGWMAEYFKYWGSGFLRFNPGNIIIMFRENFNFFFTPNNFALIGVILFILGLILLIKDKNKAGNIILLSFLGIITASILQIYPIWQRAALYLLPIIILFISKPLDLISKNKKVISFIVIVLFITYFSRYNFSYINRFLKPDIFIRTDALTTFPKLVERYKNNEILVINSTTKADFIYYSDIYKFKPKNVVLVPIDRYDKDYYYKLMNSLPKGYTYWFIFGWEYSHRTNDLESSISNHLNDYIKEHHLKLLEKYDDGNSLLMKVKMS